MFQESLEDRTAKSFIDMNSLDKDLIDFAMSDFTSSVCYFISVRPSVPSNFAQIRQGATRRLLSLLSDLERSFPPQSDTDVSGIEEIYR